MASLRCTRATPARTLVRDGRPLSLGPTPHSAAPRTRGAQLQPSSRAPGNDTSVLSAALLGAVTARLQRLGRGRRLGDVGDAWRCLLIGAPPELS